MPCATANAKTTLLRKSRHRYIKKLIGQISISPANMRTQVHQREKYIAGDFCLNMLCSTRKTRFNDST